MQVRGGYVLHVGTVEGTIRVGDKLTILVDEVKRTCIYVCIFIVCLKTSLQDSHGIFSCYLLPLVETSRAVLCIPLPLVPFM